MKKINIDADLMIHTEMEFDVSDETYNQIKEHGELFNNVEGSDEIYTKLYDELLACGDDNLKYYVFDDNGSKIIATNYGL